MPIDYSRYDPNWKEIRAAILQREGNACKECRTPNYAIGYWQADGSFRIIMHGGSRAHAQEISKQSALRGDPEKIIRIVLTIAHLDHDISNNDPSNLAALCQAHHLRHDAKLHAMHAAETKRKKAIEQGQALLLQEEEL